MSCNAIRKGNRAHNIEAGKKGRKTIGMSCNAIRKGNRAHNIEAGKKGRKRAVIALGLSVISVVVVAVVMFC